MKIYDIFRDGDIQYILREKGDNIQKLRRRHFVEIRHATRIFLSEKSLELELQQKAGAARAGTSMELKELQKAGKRKSWS